MKIRETIERIVSLWNEGKKEEAKNIFYLSQWALPEKTKEYLKDKMGFDLTIKKPDKLIVYAADLMGGTIRDNGVVVYEGKKQKKTKSGSENPKGNTRLAI